MPPLFFLREFAFSRMKREKPETLSRNPFYPEKE